MVAVFVVALEADQVAHVGHEGGGFDQLAVFGLQTEGPRQLFPQRAGYAGHLQGVGQIDAAALGELLDGRAALVGRDDLRFALLHHGEQQAVAHSAGVHLHNVHVQMPHHALDDRQAGHDDVGPIRIEAGHLTALVERHLGEVGDQVANLGRDTRKPHIGWPA